MEYNTAIHEAGHIVGYANWGFTEFLIGTDMPGTSAHVKQISGTDRNFIKPDSDIVSLMGPEAEYAFSDDGDEYVKGAVGDWTEVFNRVPTDFATYLEITCDPRIAMAQNYVDMYWSEIVSVADRIADGERHIKYTLV